MPLSNVLEALIQAVRNPFSSHAIQNVITGGGGGEVELSGLLEGMVAGERERASETALAVGGVRADRAKGHERGMSGTPSGGRTRRMRGRLERRIGTRNEEKRNKTRKEKEKIKK